MQTIEHYIILVSEHNIAEFRACLYFKPQHIHLVVTERMQKAAERFLKTLQLSKIQSQIQIIPINNEYPLTGESAQEIEHWINLVFLPYSQAWDRTNQSIILNMTGATKILSSMLLHAYPWSKIHYQPFLPQKANLFLDQLSIDSQSKNISFIERIDLDADFDLLHALHLYADSVKAHTANPIFEHPESIALAEQRLSAQHTDSKHPFCAITPVLQQLWFIEKPSSKTIFKTWDSFNYPQPDELHAFFKKLYALDNHSQNLTLNTEGVELPTIKNTQLAHWCKWMSGDWFEQLIYHWLIQQGVATQRIRIGIHIAKDASNGNETDILLLKNNQLNFLECKSDIANTQSLKDFEGQLLAQSEQLGKVNKVLILSHSIQQNKSVEQWLAFQHNCQSKNIRIVVVRQKEDLTVLI